MKSPVASRGYLTSFMTSYCINPQHPYGLKRNPFVKWMGDLTARRSPDVRIPTANAL